MKFQREVGVVLSTNGHILSLVKGNYGGVLFPQEQMWNLHKSSPGIVYALVHTHPPGLINLSSEDESTLKAWCLGLAPFPMRMAVITTENGNLHPKIYMYRGDLELKEFWTPGAVRGFEVAREYKPNFIKNKFINYLWAWSCIDGKKE